jgi:hypothetical protein
VLHEFLPIKYTLHRRHIERTAHCEVCGADEESIKHVLMDCTIARLFWDSTKHITGVKLPRLHEMTWARDLLQPDICPRKHAAIIICGMWSLWTMRNKRRHGEPHLPVRQAVEWVRHTAFDLWNMIHPEKGHVETLSFDSLRRGGHDVTRDLRRVLHARTRSVTAHIHVLIPTVMQCKHCWPNSILLHGIS